MDELNRQQDALLGSALNELPLAPLPPEFTTQVMTTIHSAKREVLSDAPIRFRLQFLDIALALFWSLVLAFVWTITLWWTGLLRLDWLPEAQASFSFVDQLVVTNPSLLLGGIMLLLLEMCLLGLVGVNLLGERTATQ